MIELIAESDLQRASVSAALATLFRGKFCDTLLPGRAVTAVTKGSTVYDVGDRQRSFFFVRTGLVKVGTVTDGGHEVIYDLRKGGDVAGELCVCDTPRRDRAVALEQTDVTVWLRHSAVVSSAWRTRARGIAIVVGPKLVVNVRARVPCR